MIQLISQTEQRCFVSSIIHQPNKMDNNYTQMISQNQFHIVVRLHSNNPETQDIKFPKGPNLFYIEISYLFIMESRYLQKTGLLSETFHPQVYQNLRKTICAINLSGSGSKSTLKVSQYLYWSKFVIHYFNRKQFVTQSFSN